MTFTSDHRVWSRWALNQTRTRRGGLRAGPTVTVGEATDDQDAGDQPQPSSTSMRRPVGLSFRSQLLIFHDLTRTDRFPHCLDRSSRPCGLTVIRGSVEIVAIVKVAEEWRRGKSRSFLRPSRRIRFSFRSLSTLKITPLKGGQLLSMAGVSSATGRSDPPSAAG